MNQKETEQFIAEMNELIEKNMEKIRKGELKITVVKDRIITPDQQRPHQFGYF